MADSNGTYHDVFPVDVEQKQAPLSFVDGLNTGGMPFTYDKLANGIFLDPIPNYNRTAGLKIYISREGSYFTSADTTKKPGIAGLFHEYFALRPSYQYALRKGLATTNSLLLAVEKMESAIQEYYKSRTHDEQKFIRPIRTAKR